MAPRKGCFDYEAAKRQLERIQIPDKVKCKICKKIRMQSAFSKRQLEDLRKAMLYNGATGLSGPGYASCHNCVGHQNVELTCCVCDKTKGLESFSKNQRRDPDRADPRQRCTNCVQQHLDTEPVSEEFRQLLEDEGTYETTASKSENMIEHSMESLSITNSGSVNTIRDGSLIDVHSKDSRSLAEADDEEPVSLSGGVWLEQGQRCQKTTVSEGITYTGFDPRGRPHARTTAPPSTTGSVMHSGWGSWGVVPSRQSQALAKNTPLKSRKNPGFAKVPGVRVPKHEAPTQRLPEPTGPTIESEDENEDENIEDWI